MRFSPIKVLHPLWSKSLNAKRHHDDNVSSDQGLSLIEALVAIVVIAVTGAMMVPPLFLTAATRVQNRRAEQALQIAQAEIDRIRTLVEQDNHDVSLLPFEVSGGLDNVPPPSGFDSNFVKSVEQCNAYTGAPMADAVTLIPVDTDVDNNDCTADFYMQVFRSEDPGASGTKPNEFRVGVRVFGASVTSNLGNLTADDVTEASLKFTTGEGNQSRRPLAVLFTDVNKGDAENSICQFYDLDSEC